MSISRRLAACLLIVACIHAYADGVPDDCTQLIVGIAPTGNSMRGELRLFERARGGDWSAVAGPFLVLFGKNGLAWGTGLAGQNEPGLRKKERDGRAPAGARPSRSFFRRPGSFWPASPVPHARPFLPNNTE